MRDPAIVLGSLAAFAAGLNFGSAQEGGKRADLVWAIFFFLVAIFFLVPAYVMSS